GRRVGRCAGGEPAADRGAEAVEQRSDGGVVVRLDHAAGDRHHRCGWGPARRCARDRGHRGEAERKDRYDERDEQPTLCVRSHRCWGTLPTANDWPPLDRLFERIGIAEIRTTSIDPNYSPPGG